MELTRQSVEILAPVGNWDVLEAAIGAGAESWAALWTRDCNLLAVARSARDKRLEKAAAALGF